MGISTWVAPAIIGALIGALVSAGALIWVYFRQRKDDQLKLKRDVLRRLVGYSYRLTPAWSGRDGEPFIALNEAWIVFSDSSQVTDALVKMRNELGEEGRLIPNIRKVIREMSDSAQVRIKNLDDRFIDSPFTPPITNSPAVGRQEA